MILSVKDIAAYINAEIIGQRGRKICGVSSFDDACPDEITFASDMKFLRHLDNTNAGAIIIPEDYDGFNPDMIPDSVSILLSKNPKLHFFRIVSVFHPEKKAKKAISPFAFIGENFVSGRDTVVAPGVTIGDGVVLGKGVCIMAGAYVGDNVSIGDGTLLRPNVTIMERSVIGRNVIIHSGTVIGSDGFGFTPDRDKHEKIPHAGFVRIDDNVEIGASVCIDRATAGKTWIGEGTKTDNLVHIAHNVIIGKNTLVVAQVGIAGSAKIGNNVIIAGKAGISGHLKVGDYSIVGPGAGVLSDIEQGKIVSGAPGMPHKLWLKVASVMPKLPDMRKKLMSLERRIKKCEGAAAEHGRPRHDKMG